MKTLSLLFAIIFLFNPNFVVADNNSVKTLYISSDYHDLHFVELQNNGEPFNEETGAMWFMGAGFYWQTKSGIFFEGSYRKSSNTLDYRGLTQQGSFVQTQSELFLQDTSLFFGRNFGRTSAFIGLSRHFRERNVLGTQNILGIYEEFEQTNGIFGLRTNLFPQKRFQVRLEARAWTDLNSNVYVSSSGRADPATFDGGKSFGYRTAAEFFYSLNNQLGISLVPAYEYTHIDKSKMYPLFLNGEPLYRNQHQPETEWESYSISGKISWSF